MKLTFLYGTDETKIAGALMQLKKEHPAAEILELDGSCLAIQELKEALGVQGLFGLDRLIIVKEPAAELDLTGLVFEGVNLVFIAEKELSSESTLVISSKPFKPQILNLSTRQTVTAFPFLDFLFTKNPQAYIELEKLLKQFGAQYVLAMIGYGCRRLILSGKQSDFMLQKLAVQKKLFPVAALPFYYQEILETDFKIKQGRVREDIGLVSLIEKFLRANPPEIS